MPILNALFKALNDPTRRAIPERMRGRPATAGTIAEQFQFSAPTISHHLNLLRQAGLVTSQQRGQFVVYTLNMTVFDELLGLRITRAGAFLVILNSVAWNYIALIIE